MENNNKESCEINCENSDYCVRKERKQLIVKQGIVQNAEKLVKFRS